MPPSPESSGKSLRAGRAPSIFLIGYRGSGKTSAGSALARAMGRPFHDTDRMVEAAAGKSIARVFAEDGQPAFRAMESKALDDLARRARAGERFVAATGGGIILHPGNVALLRAAGLVVWLTAPPGVLRDRIASDPGSVSSRPAFSGRSNRDEVEELLAEREPLYRAAAHREVAVAGASVEEVASRILRESERPVAAVSERPPDD